MNNKEITVLFTMNNSIYDQLGCNTYNKERNALTWEGGKPAIYHPPCRAWGKLKHFAKPTPGEKELALWSIANIRKWGGILEHPWGSDLFRTILPRPGTIDEFGGSTIVIDQRWFGHQVQKRTGIYIVGIKPKDIPKTPLNFDLITHTLGGSKPGYKEISKKARSATPIKLAKWLIEICASIPNS